MTRTTTVLLVVATAWSTACTSDDRSSRDAYAPRVDPSAFSTDVDNPYFPLPVGTRWLYEGTTDEGVERIVVEVTARTKKVMGVETVVVRDTVTVDGAVVEDTFDWFAQDADGNVWYFGEETKEYEHGEVVSTAGAWEAGVDGAQPGIVMPATPAVGGSYRQEYYRGEAEDMGQVVKVGETVTVGMGRFADVIVTKDWTPLEPDVAEHKYYAPGVGLVLEAQVEGGTDRVELVETTAG